MEPERFVSPCDGKVSVSKLDEKSVFQIKHTRYTAERLLRNRKLAKAYAGGYLWVFRLRWRVLTVYLYRPGRGVRICPDSPAYFIRSILWRTMYFLFTRKIPGNIPFFARKISEQCCRWKLVHCWWGKSRITARGECSAADRKREPSLSADRRSRLLMTQKGRVYPDQDLLEYSRRGIEVSVRQGEAVGRANQVLFFRTN